MGIFAADRVFLEEIGGLDGGMTIYGGENVELGIRVSNKKNLVHNLNHLKVEDLGDHL